MSTSSGESHDLESPGLEQKIKLVLNLVVWVTNK